MAKYTDKTQTPKHSLNSFIFFLERQPADKIYNYPDCSECAIGQYAKSIGCTYHDIPAKFTHEWNEFIAGPAPWTYGAAAARARTFV